MPIFEQPVDEPYRVIPLTKGQIALVSLEDYERISIRRWSAVWFQKANTWYAARYEYDRPKLKRTIMMHNEIMGIPPDGLTVDHAFHNTLDNRRFVNGQANLRFATQSQQNCNHRRASNNTSGFKGVSWAKDAKLWRAYINIYGHRFALGYFNSAEEAHNAYRAAALRLHGNFACVGENEGQKIAAAKQGSR